MEQNDTLYIPKYLNAEPQILWWDLSHFLVLVIFFSIGILFDCQYSATFLGIVFLNLFGYLNNNFPAGYIKHFFYSLGLYGLKNRVPEFWIKEIRL